MKRQSPLFELSLSRITCCLVVFFYPRGNRHFRFNVNIILIPKFNLGLHSTFHYEDKSAGYWERIKSNALD